MPINTYQDLIVWQVAMDLAEKVYGLVRLLPTEEKFSLSDQMRRAAVSIPSNIAEGHGRNSTKSYIHFLMIARGSKAELETQLLLCVRVGYVTQKQIDPVLAKCDEVGKMIFSIINKLNQRCDGK